MKLEKMFQFLLNISNWELKENTLKKNNNKKKNTTNKIAS